METGGQPRLGATAHAALVLLAFGEASGYELKQRADRTLRFFFNSPAMSQIYSELDRLTNAGLVEDRLDVRGGDRQTRVFRLSTSGGEELRRWLADEPLPPTAFKSHLALRFIVGHLADPDRMRADVATERGRIEQELADVREVHDALDPGHHELGWAWLIANWGVRYFAAMLDQLDELSGHLDVLVERTRDPATARQPLTAVRSDDP
ncbi:MAG: PadR family transcriptional regulator [Actinomycetota bacterium]|nr:PadR family transcriptional regulator [Actinomycetota bacterium]